MPKNIRRTGIVGKQSFQKDLERIRAAVITSGGTGSGTDHGTLTGLGDDDHSQYYHLSQDETILGQSTFQPGSAQPPFLLHVNAQGQTVTGFKADQLNKQVIAGSGLTGGGFLTADRTLNVGAGNGISVGAVTVILTTPTVNLSVSSPNVADGWGHTHVIDSSADPGATAAILATSTLGRLNVHDLRAGPNTDITTQFRVEYDPTNYAAMKVSSNSDLEITTQVNGDIRLRPGGTGYVWGDSSWIIGANVVPPGIFTIRDATQPQLRVDYDANNYMAFSIDSVADATLSLTSSGSGASFTFDIEGSIFFDPEGNNVNPVINYDVNLGQINKKYLSLYVAELWADTLVAQETIATIGGRILVGPTTRLTQDLDVADTSIFVEHNQMTSGDVVYLEKDLKVEFLSITGNAVESAELLSNVGFETGGAGDPDFWASWIETASDGTLANETTLFNLGVDAVKMTAGASVDTRIHQDGTVVADTRHKLTFWTRGDGTYSGRFRVEDRDALVDIIPLRSAGNATTTYARKSIFFTTPAGCTTVRVYFYCADTVSGVCYFDNGQHGDPLIDENMLMEAEYSYTVTRDLDGTGANDWLTGDAVFNTGQTGDGFIDLYSLRGLIPGTTTGPTIVGNVRSSATFNDWTEHWAIGNLKGLYGYGSDTYGAGFGKYQDDWITVDSANGIRLNNNNILTGQWKTNGDLILGEVAANQANVFFDNADEALKFRINAISHFELDGTYNGIAGRAVLLMGEDTGDQNKVSLLVVGLGAPVFNGETLAAGDIIIGRNDAGFGNVFYDASAQRLNFRGGTTTEAYVDTDGSIRAGGGVVGLDSDGIWILSPTSYSDVRSYKFVETAGGASKGRLTQKFLGGNAVHLALETSSTEVFGFIDIEAFGSDTREVTLIASTSTFEVRGGPSVAETITAVSGLISLFGNVIIGGAGAGGLRVGDNATPSDNDIRAVGDIACGDGLWVGNVNGEPGNGILAVDADARIGGGLVVGSTAFDGATGYGYFNNGIVVGILSTSVDVDNAVYITNRLLINDTANSNQSRGITVRQATGGSGNHIISLKETGVAHGITSVVETDTFGFLRELADNAGGLILYGLSDAGRGLVLIGYGVTTNSATSTSALAQVEVHAGKKSGTGVTALAAGENMFVAINNGLARMILKGNGGLWLGASITSGGGGDAATRLMDDYDDMRLLTGARAIMSADEEANLKKGFNEFIDYARPVLEEANIVTVNDGQYGNENDGSVFMNVQGMFMLTIDTIRQQHQRMNLMEAALLEAGIKVPQLHGGSE